MGKGVGGLENWRIFVDVICVSPLSPSGISLRTLPRVKFDNGMFDLSHNKLNFQRVQPNTI